MAVAMGAGVYVSEGEGGSLNRVEVAGIGEEADGFASGVTPEVEQAARKMTNMYKQDRFVAMDASRNEKLFIGFPFFQLHLPDGFEQRAALFETGFAQVAQAKVDPATTAA